MKNIFIRHGKAAVPEFGKLNDNEFQQWITVYNQAMQDHSL
ncbi:MAG: hypothetical protein ABGX71_05290 [Methyloprofundus sp.]|nr:hypothetical protein [Methyloprofundus sp.]